MYRVLTQCKNLDVNDDHLDTHRDDIFDTKATSNSEHKGTAEREPTINKFLATKLCASNIVRGHKSNAIARNFTR